MAEVGSDEWPDMGSGEWPGSGNNTCSWAEASVEVKLAYRAVATTGSVMSVVGALTVLLLIGALGKAGRAPSSVWPMITALACSDLIQFLVILIRRVLIATDALTVGVCRVLEPVIYASFCAIPLWSGAVAVRLGLNLSLRDVTIPVWWFHAAVWPLPLLTFVVGVAHPYYIDLDEGRCFLDGSPLSLVYSIMNVGVALSLGSIVGYLTTAARDRAVGKAVRVRNVRQLEGYLVW